VRSAQTVYLQPTCVQPDLTDKPSVLHVVACCVARGVLPKQFTGRSHRGRSKSPAPLAPPPAATGVKVEGAQHSRPVQQHGGKGGTMPLKSCLKQSDAPKRFSESAQVISASYDSNEEISVDSDSDSSEEGDSSSSSGSEGGDTDADDADMSGWTRRMLKMM
jgi:hypothetical protein